jgi:hypothetical protein
MGLDLTELDKKLVDVNDPQENLLSNILSDTVTDGSELSSNLFVCDSCDKGFF